MTPAMGMSVFASDFDDIIQSNSLPDDIIRDDSDITLKDWLDDNDGDLIFDGIRENSELSDEISETKEDRASANSEPAKSKSSISSNFAGSDEDDDSYDNEEDDATDYSGYGSSNGKLGNGLKLSGDVKNRIITYVNSLNGKFTSPYRRGGMALAWQCCAFVNQVWRNVFDSDLYSIPDSNKNQYSKNGESAYEFFERVGVKTGDVIYTRYAKTKKNDNGHVIYDKNGDAKMTMGQHFVIVLDYDEDFVWYTDGYESKTRGFVISSINKKVKYSESKYFRNKGGAYANIEGANYAMAGMKGCRFRYYSIPSAKWKLAGGKIATDGSKYWAEGFGNDVKIARFGQESMGDLRIEHLEEDDELNRIEYEYCGEEIRPQIDVYDGVELLREKIDYAIKYDNNVDAGEAVVMIRGAGMHKGAISANYIIKAYDLREHLIEDELNSDEIESDEFGSDEDVKFGVHVKDIEVLENGEIQKIKPLITCTVSSNSISGNRINTLRLEEGIDYELDYPSSRDRDGAYRDALTGNDQPYIIKVKGIGNFTGEILVKEWIRERNR